MMKYLFLMIASLSLSPLLAADLKSNWATTVMTIDGDGDEWRDAVFSYFDDDQTAIALKNDSGAIYLMVITKDEPTVMMLERTGLVVWLNGDGKKNRDHGFRYRAGRLSNEKRKMPEGMYEREDMPERREKMEQEQSRQRGIITVIDKKNTAEISSRGEDGPAAAATFAKEIYAVEFKIPILTSADSGIGLAPKNNSQIMLGVEIGYVSDADKKQMQERMRPPQGGMIGGGIGGSPRGGGGMGGGDRGGPGSHGRPGGNRNAGKKEFWFKFELAQGT